MNAQELAVIPADNTQLIAGLEAEAGVEAFDPNASAEQQAEAGARCYRNSFAQMVAAGRRWGDAQAKGLSLRAIAAKNNCSHLHVDRAIKLCYNVVIAEPRLIGHVKSLGYTKAIELTALPREEQQALAEGSEVRGITIDALPELSVRDLRAKLKEHSAEAEKHAYEVRKLKEQHDKDQQQIADLIAKTEAEEIDRTPEVVKQTTREAMAIAAAHCQLCAELKDNLLHLDKTFAMNKSAERKQNLRDALRPIAHSIGIAFGALAEVNQLAQEKFSDSMPVTADEVNAYYLSRSQAKETIDQMLGKITSCLAPLDLLVAEQERKKWDGRHTMTTKERERYLTSFEQSMRKLK